MLTVTHKSIVTSSTATNVPKTLIYWMGVERRLWLVFLAASFLVSVPVFIQAPLVRIFPWVSLFATGIWLGLGLVLYYRTKTHIWGDLIWGFSWSWLAGSIYWGWLRWEPFLHIPVEAIGLPVAIWCLWRGWGAIGSLFYLGSLLGTAITDLYFYLTGLIPYWREIMLVEPNLVKPILQDALVHMQTAWGISWAIVLLNLLIAIGLWSAKKRKSSWWAFSGAVFSTILVDGLFWLAAALA
ncbi:MAG: DUF3120 domain-containing protein [Cyanobacteria bacterium J083]|nr:MAG: DUF3120 domain-containing protein [Cyanobacteria bacterium J083]